MSGCASPRTAAEPMAFTRSEFLRGALRAWLWAIVLIIGAWSVMYFPAGMLSAIYVLPASVAAVVVFVAPAWWLGRGLRRVDRFGVHLAAFAALGAVVGAITSVVFMAVMGGAAGLDGSIVLSSVINVLASAAAVALGWRNAARRALAPAPPESSDPDAAAEDADARRFGPRPPSP